MRTVKNLPFGSTITDMEKVAKEITPATPVLLIENDCVLATGKSVINAFDRVEVASFTADTIIKAKPLGNVVMITDEEVELIRKTFCM
jgi:L-fuculose-phosphate aldolase